MELSEYIKKRRLELGMSRNKLATEAGISHTEIHRIETGERKNPSLQVIGALAAALNVSQEDLMKETGLMSSDSISPVNRAFPGLKTDKQKETISKIADGLSRNAQLKNEDLDDLYRQVEMFIDYAKRKKAAK